MRLGIDFGTTRIVVAAADRGNYPVVQFESDDDSTRDWFPPLVAARGQERRYGWDAWALQADPEWTIVRSLKRILQDAGPRTEIELGDAVVPLRQLLGEMTGALRQALLESSNLPAKEGEKLEVQLGVPANANTNQRFLTSEAFRWGGFEVLGLLNEPSAACIEFSHLNPQPEGEERYLLVYDLGGGTFDASLVRVAGTQHDVVATEGISTLGGDDFDDVLAEMALESIGRSEEDREGLSQAVWFRLREECRQRKESVRPNSRRIVLDLEWVHEGWGEARVSVADYYDRCTPAADETLHAVDDLLGRCGFAPDGSAEDEKKLEAVYVAGGGSELPMVPRGLRDKFGRRVRRSAHGRQSTAIGLAIQADETKGYVLRDRFTRYFGVWRERDHGTGILFDPLFWKDAALPASGEEPLTIVRDYQPTHNVGHFRYLECSHIAEDGQPAGDITLWDEILFPFDPGLKDNAELSSVGVGWNEAACGQTIQEVYTCDASGRLGVKIRNLTSDYERDFRLGRWAASDKRLKPGRRGSATPKRKRKAAKKG